MKTFFSPGRVNIIGEHLDYNGGDVLPICLDIGTYGYVTQLDEQVIELSSRNFTEDKTLFVDYSKEFSKTGKWFDYVLGCLDVLRKHGYENKHGFKLEIEGNIPNSSGLSSSASLEVLILTILNDLNDFKISDKDIAIFAQEAENEFVGVNCGIMDQFIIANGVKDNALKINCQNLTFDTIDANLGKHTFVILNTNTKRGLVDSEYNERRASCDTGFKIFSEKYNINCICELSLEQLNSVEIEPLTYKRLKHAITEQKRVTECSKALINKDYHLIGKLLNESHESLKNDFEVSSSNLDTFTQIARDNGALGARMTGAGFGGCAVALFDHKLSEGEISTMLEQYQNQTNVMGEIYNVTISDKAHRIS